MCACVLLLLMSILSAEAEVLERKRGRRENTSTSAALDLFSPAFLPLLPLGALPKRCACVRASA